MLPMLCVAYRREVIEKVGLLDERFGMGMYEDDDYAMRLQVAGYHLLCTDSVFVHHFGSSTFNLYGQDLYQRILEENRKKYESKWGITWEPHGHR